MSTYEISKSSLVSLKAEILRKQQELSKVKAANDIKILNIKKNTPIEFKNKGVEERSKKDLTEQEENQLKKSRSILEAKSKLYDQLSKKSSELNEDEKKLRSQLLVRFDSKNSHLPPEESDNEDKYPESEEESFNESYDDPKDASEEWVEYVDCLGRTRTCLRKDLKHIKKDDENLKEIQRKRKEVSPVWNTVKETKEPFLEATEEEDIASISDEKKELLSADMRRDFLRKQWEKEEEELNNKTNIHYQDILFSEARTHGVGYYGFSKDEVERATQQEALKKLRKETEEQQKKMQDLKAQRKKQLAARIKAAKNRKRARMGLAPEEESETSVEENKSEEKPEKLPEKNEKDELLEEARKNHIRPWDIGKEALKEHYVYSQGEWVDKKRSERPKEFAPPSSYRKNFRSNVEEDSFREEKKSLKFSSRKDNYTRNYEEVEQSKPMDPTPIKDECEDGKDRLLADYHKINDKYSSNGSNKDSSKYSSSDSDSDNEIRGKGAEFAPPPTFDYYGPSSSKKYKPTKSNNVEDSIEAGLKFLRHQVEKKGSGKHDKDMFLF
ncbi:unnamed protein product [Brassicogethes aeneus]|uniref:CCDC174 alpha/beta GRSR domain-containing protein n=1 Tax=Brassicogethes aeneus TaxID=1431903 RepID=A0A9P0FFK8_BRAAE|nr:unnamed protein product [Brassicogethes aeneus]